MPETRVEIGGVGLLFRYRNSRIKESKSSTLNIKDFIRPGKSDFIIDIGQPGKLPEYPEKGLLFEARENWRLHESGREIIFETYKSREDEGSRKVCVMGKDLSGAKIYLPPGVDTLGNEMTWSLERLMRVLGQLIFTSILHKYQGLLIHSSGIILDGEGMIFCGVSGAGKTTLAKLWQGKDKVTVLNDDRVLARKEGEEYFVYGTPWPGEGKVVSCEKAPLKKIFFLFKTKENKIVPFKMKEAFRQLITQCFPAIWDKESIEFSLKFCEALVRDVPCFSFGFVPDETAPEFLENKLPGRCIPLTT